MTSKYFKTKEEFNMYINDLYTKKIEGIPSLIDALEVGPVTGEELLENLIKDGYTDLENLVEDGHAYEFAGHKNHGWLYEDEVDMEYAKAAGHVLNLKKRKR